MRRPHEIHPFFATPDSRYADEMEALANDISELSAHIAAATFQLLEMLAIFDEREGWALHGCASCAHWLQWKCGTNLGAAREKVRVARALPGLPLIREAFRSGMISYSKVRAMTRVATPDNEAFLLEIAHHGTALHVEKTVRNFRRHQRLELLKRDQAATASHVAATTTWSTCMPRSRRCRTTVTPRPLIAKAGETFPRKRRPDPGEEPPGGSGHRSGHPRKSLARRGDGL